MCSISLQHIPLVISIPPLVMTTRARLHHHPMATDASSWYVHQRSPGMCRYVHQDDASVAITGGQYPFFTVLRRTIKLYSSISENFQWQSLVMSSAVFRSCFESRKQGRAEGGGPAAAPSAEPRRNKRTRPSSIVCAWASSEHYHYPVW